MATKFELGTDGEYQMQASGGKWETLDCGFDVRFEKEKCQEGVPWTGFWGGVVRGDFLVSKVEGGWQFTQTGDGWTFELFEADTPSGEAELWDFLAESGEAVDMTMEWGKTDG